MEIQSKAGRNEIIKQVLALAIPIAATSIIQQLFNATDTAVVGRFASGKALAAVGSTSSVVSFFITILSGLSVGANFLIAHSIGAGDKKRVKQGVDTAMLLSVIGGLLLVILGQLIGKPLLQIMGTPADIIGDAVRYIRIFMLGLFFLMIYNFEAAILRACGDAKKPLYCLMVSGVLNLGCNLLFVIGFQMGVIGVALGTLIADIANAAMLFYFLRKGNGTVKISFPDFSPDRRLVKTILMIGIPAALQGIMFNISNIIIQSGINSLGSDVIAGSTIALNAEIFVFYMLTGFGQASVTLNGQCLGAGDLKRAKRTTLYCLILAEIFTLLFAYSFIIFAESFCSIFTTEAALIQTATLRIRIVLFAYMLNIVIEILSGAMRGLGHSALPAVVTMVGICFFRIIWVLFVFPQMHTFRTLLFAYPISWLLNSTAIVIAYFTVIKKLDQTIGKAEI